MALLSGFEEVRLIKPIGKTVLTVTDSAIRFNKATAEALGFAPFAKVLVNDKTRQIAVTAAASKEGNAVKFSKPADKQTASVSVKDAAVVAAVRRYFTLADAPEGEIAYESVNGTAYVDDRTVIFNVDDAVSGTMKRRGRRKAAGTETSSSPAEA